MLILAGITIAGLSNSGLFNKTQEAKEKWDNAENDENDKIAKYTNEIESYVSGNRDSEKYEKLRNDIIKALNDKNIDVTSENTDQEIINSIIGIKSEFVLIESDCSGRYEKQIDVSTKIDNYENLTADDFITILTGCNFAPPSQSPDVLTLTKTYDPTTGILNFSACKSFFPGSGKTAWSVYDVYLVK